RSQPLNDLFQHRARTAAGERRFRVAGERACARWRSGVQSARRKKRRAAGGASRKPVRIRRGPATVRGPSETRFARSEVPLGDSPGRRARQPQARRPAHPAPRHHPSQGRDPGLFVAASLTNPVPPLLGARDGVFGMRHARAGRAALIAVVLLSGFACTREARSLGRDGRGTPACVDAGLEARRPAERIVSLVPSVTEILVALGAGDRLVARTEYDTDPTLARLPSVGGGLNPSLERLTVLRPDLVVGW